METMWDDRAKRERYGLGIKWYYFAIDVAKMIIRSSGFPGRSDRGTLMQAGLGTRKGFILELAPELPSGTITMV
jgi:hypothetical protein